MTYEELKNKYPELNWIEAEEVTNDDLETAAIIFDNYVKEYNEIKLINQNKKTAPQPMTGCDAVFLESYFFFPKRSSNFATRPPVSRMRCLPV